MASFLDDIGNTIFQQQDLAEFQQVSPADLLSRASGLLPQIGAFNLAAAQQQAGLVPIENQIRGLRYGEAINPLQATYTQNILDNLNMGNQLPDDVQQQVIQNALQGSAASGFGLSPGGRALVGRDLGLTSLDIGGQRRNEALNALKAFPGERIQPALSPMTALDLEQQSIDVANQRRAQEAGVRNSNRMAVMSSLAQYAELGGSVFGSAVGSAFGTKGIGTGFSSILSGLGKGGGGTQAMREIASQRGGVPLNSYQ